MGTSWKNDDIAVDFDNYDDYLEQYLGYSFVYRWLPLDGSRSSIILDYGCGPGKVSYAVSQYGNNKIIAVDESEEMLSIARQKRQLPSILYKKIENDSLDFIENNSVDAAIICFVLLNLASNEQISKILQETNRVLKSGAPCIILDTNPESIGVRFSTFQSGAAGKNYRDGDKREAWLYLPNGKTISLLGYHWSLSAYYNSLINAGFHAIQQDSPTLKKLSDHELLQYQRDHMDCLHSKEWDTPPFVIFRAIK